jgi:dihydrodipicolinate synthase/N-acetylneuraminate lyase
MAVVFGGVGVALVTLFGADGEIDPVATGKHAADLASRGVTGVLVCGTTAEAATLTEAERVMLIEAVRAALPEDVPVIAGTGAPSARQAVTLTKMAVAAGADAMLTWCPAGAGGPPSPAALAGFYAAIGEAAGDRPVLAYHNPFITCADLPVIDLGALPVAGLKDSSGRPDRLLDELTSYSGDTYVGSAGFLALAGPMGAAGGLLALANLLPEECVAAFGGDVAVQRALARPHLVMSRGGIPQLKQMLAETAGLSPVCRIW